MLVVVFHTSIAYGAGGSWILEDVDKSQFTLSMVLLTIFTLVNQAYFMALFFFLSAYFIPGSYDRKGPLQFMKDRLIRLGVPLLVYYFGIGPMTIWYARYRGMETLGEFYASRVFSFQTTFFGPAWFLEASLWFAVIYTLLRLILRAYAKDSERRHSASFPTNRTLLITALFAGITAFGLRLIFPTGTGPLELQLGYFPLYILLFCAGIIARRNNWLDQIPAKMAAAWRWIAIGVIPLLPIGLILTGALEGNLQLYGGVNIQALLYAIWEPFVCFGIILALLVRYRTRYNKTSAFRSWLSKHAYTVFIIHPPVIVGWTMAFHGLPLPPIMKWVLVSGLALVTCFAAAGLIRSVPGTQKVL